MEVANTLRPGQRGKGAARVHLPGRRDRFNAGGMAHVSTHERRTLRDRIEARIHRAGVERDPEREVLPESLRLPVLRADGLAKREHEFAGRTGTVENEVEPVAP